MRIFQAGNLKNNELKKAVRFKLTLILGQTASIGVRWKTIAQKSLHFADAPTRGNSKWRFS